MIRGGRRIAPRRIRTEHFCKRNSQRLNGGCSNHARLAIGADALSERANVDTYQMNDKKIMHIPLPGSSGAVPTGALQFQNDWPGLFVRGDEAIPLAVKIRAMDKALENNDNVTVEAALIQLRRLAQIVEKDVQTR